MIIQTVSNCHSCASVQSPRNSMHHLYQRSVTRECCVAPCIAAAAALILQASLTCHIRLAMHVHDARWCTDCSLTK